MCGLTGFWGPPLPTDESRKILGAMVAAIRKRGPDAHGSWFDPAAGLALGHRRLSVLELSECGAQPMVSNSGRFVLVFNGEIYNHLDLRALIGSAAAGRFRGTSDTETLLAAFERWGIAGTLSRSVGMFALACWDRQEKAVYLARDRMGEKPLYYGWQGEGGRRTFLFGSELKALVLHPAFEARIDRESVSAYFARLCVPGSKSIWSGISKVKPGTVLRVDAGGEIATEVFWSLEETIAAGLANRIDDPQEALELVHGKLAAAVNGQLMSDVPLGAFLSGGVDSSLIVALMQEAAGGGAQTFSIGFEEDAFNEAQHARAVAEHLRTDHHELVVTAERARSVIPALPDIYDEPFADSSQIPTVLVAQLARSQVTVALSGDGADELFGGYPRYPKALQAWQRLRLVPAPLRHASVATSRPMAPVLPLRLARAAALADASNVVDFYARYTDHALGIFHHRGENRERSLPAALEPFERLMAHDQLGYLPDDILVKVDRAAMAVSLETRAPFLDTHVIAASWQIASGLKQKYEGGRHVSKWVLRRLLDRYVPRRLIERPKQGFGVPIGSWLRGALRDWADDYLAVDRLDRAGLVDVGLVSSLWSDHRSSRADHTELLWAVLMLECWYERQRVAASHRPGSETVRCAV